MDTELFFRVAFAVVFAFFWALRFYYGRKANKNENTIKSENLKQDKPIIFFVIGLPIITFGFLYVLMPSWIAAASLNLPSTARWIGIVLGLSGIGIYWWVLHSLGRQWSLFLVIKENHQLIDFGPYRWVRHPMYTVFFFMGFTFFLISSNGLIGLSWFGLFVSILSRITQEESLLIDQFGDQYRGYMQKTGRFFPN